jgi:hypothetical protein
MFLRAIICPESRQTLDPPELVLRDVGDGRKTGGIVGHRDASRPFRWVRYVAVIDVNFTTDKARTPGATVL